MVVQAEEVDESDRDEEKVTAVDGGGAKLLDMAFNGDEDDLLTDSISVESEESVGSGGSSSSVNHSYVSQSCASAVGGGVGAGSKQISMSLTNLPFSTQTSGAPINASEPNLISKELFEQNINVSLLNDEFNWFNSLF